MASLRALAAAAIWVPVAAMRDSFGIDEKLLKAHQQPKLSVDPLAREPPKEPVIPAVSASQAAATALAQVNGSIGEDAWFPADGSACNSLCGAASVDLLLSTFRGDATVTFPFSELPGGSLPEDQCAKCEYWLEWLYKQPCPFDMERFHQSKHAQKPSSVCCKRERCVKLEWD